MGAGWVLRQKPNASHTICWGVWALQEVFDGIDSFGAEKAKVCSLMSDLREAAELKATCMNHTAKPNQPVKSTSKTNQGAKPTNKLRNRKTLQEDTEPSV